MEILNQTPVKEPKVRGRRPTYTQEYMLMVAKKIVEGDLTYREITKRCSLNAGIRQPRRSDWCIPELKSIVLQLLLANSHIRFSHK